MGRFGISFSDESRRGFKIENRKHYATITHEDEPQTDGPFQRYLAWTSYIVMVLTSYFMMNAGAMAQANHVSRHHDLSPPAMSIIHSGENQFVVPWQLRGSN